MANPGYIPTAEAAPGKIPQKYLLNILIACLINGPPSMFNGSNRIDFRCTAQQQQQQQHAITFVTSSKTFHKLFQVLRLTAGPDTLRELLREPAFRLLRWPRYRFHFLSGGDRVGRHSLKTFSGWLITQKDNVSRSPIHLYTYTPLANTRDAQSRLTFTSSRR